MWIPESHREISSNLDTRIPQENRLQFGYQNPAGKSAPIWIPESRRKLASIWIPKSRRKSAPIWIPESRREIGSNLDTGISQGNRL
ncbi:uncharacterized protein OCT59_021389 [Rhizophagus irregularis]|uniref:uncharacterized protein n=1 Tax=Rhizophagus irregularis TaxID=588596 RepID=UPI000CB66475|nr:hypothetical protein OCT59_021389 [Rhizophagus irregularis]